MTDYFNDLLTLLDKVQGLPAVALVFCSCIVVGYICKAIKRLPNEAIPLVVHLWGVVFMMFIADARPNTMLARIWVVRNIGVGLLLAFLAWQLHYWLLYKIDEYIGKKFGKAPAQDENQNNQPPTASAQP